MVRRFYRITAIFMMLFFASACDRADERQRPPAPGQSKPLHFSGTFLQLVESRSQWTLSQWARLFCYFRTLGVRKLIIQWSAFNDQNSTFPYGPGLPAIRPELKTILELADQYKIKLYVGLNYDAGYWKRIGLDVHSVKTYLQNLNEKNAQLARILAPLLQAHRSFSGWYLTDEIDDVNWNTKEKRELLVNYLQSLSGQLHQLTPDKKVILSGFSNAALSPEQMTEFWYEILSRTPVDVVLFQDGVGVHKLTLEQLPAYVDAIHWAAEFAHKKFDVIVEVFQQIAGAPINKQPFKAVPAPLERIRKQMKIAALYSPELWAFSIPDYMTPDAGDDARHLFGYFHAQRILNQSADRR
jgi:hypothetical protein